MLPRNLKRLTVAVATGLGLVFATGSAHALPILFAVDGASSNDSTLYSLDPTSGAIIDTIGPTNFSHVTGLAVDPITGGLYGFSNGSGSGTGQLLLIDPSTGAATAIGPTTERRIPDISFDSSGTLYGWCELFCTDQSGVGTDDLVTIDLTTGLSTVVGFSSVFTAQTGLAFDTADNLFLTAVDDLFTVDNLFTVDPQSGQLNFESALSGGPATQLHNSLAFDQNNKLFSITHAPGSGGGFQLQTLVEMVGCIRST